MSAIENETVRRQGTCPEHGQVRAVKQVPKIQFPFMLTAPARAIAALRPFHCPECGAKVS